MTCRDFSSIAGLKIATYINWKYEWVAFANYMLAVFCLWSVVIPWNHLCPSAALQFIYFLLLRKSVLFSLSVYCAEKKRNSFHRRFFLCSGTGRWEWVCAGHCPACWPEDHKYVCRDSHCTASATAWGWPVWWPVEDKVGGNHLIHRHSRG